MTPRVTTVAAEERVNAIADIGVRSMPAEDSGVMLAFKRSLSPGDQHLLQVTPKKTPRSQSLLRQLHESDSCEIKLTRYVTHAPFGPGVSILKVIRLIRRFSLEFQIYSLFCRRQVLLIWSDLNKECLNK